MVRNFLVCLFSHKAASTVSGLEILAFLGLLLGAWMIENADKIVYSKFERYFIQTCFYVSKNSVEIDSEERIRCFYASPGKYPPLNGAYDHARRRCCFTTAPEDGVFWLIGERVASPVTSVSAERGTASENMHPESRKFDISVYETMLVDILALDSRTDAPVPGVRVSMSDHPIHLLAYTKLTDSDGYAVLPVIPSHPMTISLRSPLHIPPRPFEITPDKNVSEYVVELDRGVRISGSVTDDTGRAVPNARIHVEAEKNGAWAWSSDIDLPRPVAQYVAADTRFTARRYNMRTDVQGRFEIDGIPRARLRIYAALEHAAPSDVLSADARDSENLSGLRLSIKRPKKARMRVENAGHGAVRAHVEVFDDATGEPLQALMTPASGSAQIHGLSSRVKIYASADGYLPLNVARDILDGDEIVIGMEKAPDQPLRVLVRDISGAPLQGVSLYTPEGALRKRSGGCLGRTDHAGGASLPNCPETGILIAEHPEKAIKFVHYSNLNDEYRIELESGEDCHISIVDEKTRLGIGDFQCSVTQCEVSDDASRACVSQTYASRDGALHVRCASGLSFRYQCRTPVYGVFGGEWEARNAPPEIVLPHRVQIRVQAVDGFGGAVPYARIAVSGNVFETDEYGRAVIFAHPGDWLEAVHWQHGKMTLKIAQNQTSAELAFPDKPDMQLVACLENLGIRAIVDSATVLVDEISKYRDSGILRGDAVEVCRNGVVVVVRDGRRIEAVLDAVR